jgi:hypothetical protein
MKNFQIGFTELYNSFHDPIQKNADFEKLRTTHIEMDCEILRLFGWVDIELGYDFHKTDLGTRFTISDDARREVLTRLLQLNHQRYEEEVLAGLHGEKERKNWIREHGESYMGSQQHGQLSLIDDAPSQGTLLYETKDKAAGERKPEYYRCWKCGRLLTAEDRDAHTREVHGGEDPGYAGVG